MKKQIEKQIREPKTMMHAAAKPEGNGSTSAIPKRADLTLSPARKVTRMESQEADDEVGNSDVERNGHEIAQVCEVVGGHLHGRAPQTGVGVGVTFFAQQSAAKRRNGG